MAGTGPRDLHLLCQELLEAATDALDTIPNFEPGLAGAPARTFLSPGDPALDCCDQLTVNVTSSTFIAPVQGPLAKAPDRINGPTLVVTATRCIPTGEEPPIADMEAAAEQINADGWALWNHLFNLWRSEMLFTLCGVLSMNLQPMPPSGGCAGWRLIVQTNLEGYEEVLSS